MVCFIFPDVFRKPSVNFFLKSRVLPDHTIELTYYIKHNKRKKVEIKRNNISFYLLIPGTTLVKIKSKSNEWLLKIVRRSYEWVKELHLQEKSIFC